MGVHSQQRPTFGFLTTSLVPWQPPATTRSSTQWRCRRVGRSVAQALPAGALPAKPWRPELKFSSENPQLPGDMAPVPAVSPATLGRSAGLESVGSSDPRLNLRACDWKYWTNTCRRLRSGWLAAGTGPGRSVSCADPNCLGERCEKRQISHRIDLKCLSMDPGLPMYTASLIPSNVQQLLQQLEKHES